MSTRFQRPSGSLSARIKGAQFILRERADNARRIARVIDDPRSLEAASLRGKATAYIEAAELLERIDRGGALGFRKWTRKDPKRTAPTPPEPDESNTEGAMST